MTEHWRDLEDQARLSEKADAERRAAVRRAEEERARSAEMHRRLQTASLRISLANKADVLHSALEDNRDLETLDPELFRRARQHLEQLREEEEMDTSWRRRTTRRPNNERTESERTKEYQIGALALIVGVILAIVFIALLAAGSGGAAKWILPILAYAAIHLGVELMYWARHDSAGD